MHHYFVSSTLKENITSIMKVICILYKHELSFPEKIMLRSNICPFEIFYNLLTQYLLNMKACFLFLKNIRLNKKIENNSTEKVLFTKVNELKLI